MTRVSIIIVNWNGAHLLSACLDALQLQSRPADEVIVVDNASRDNSIALLQTTYPWVRLLPLSSNTGLAGGTNAGIAASGGEIIVTLNNDTIATPDWLAALCAPFDDNPRLGSTMSTMLFAHESTRIASAGLAIFRNGLVLDDLVGVPHSAVEEVTRPIFGPSAGAAAYRRTMFADIGGFDADFFMYLEDADLAWRARLRGWESLHVPAATILHIYSASSGQGSPLKQYYLARNRLWCMRKNLPHELVRENWRAIAGYDLGALAYSLLKSQSSGIRGRIAGFTDRTIVGKRRRIQARRTAEINQLRRWLRPCPTISNILKLQRRIDQLSLPQTQTTP